MATGSCTTEGEGAAAFTSRMLGPFEAVTRRSFPYLGLRIFLTPLDAVRSRRRDWIRRRCSEFRPGCWGRRFARAKPLQKLVFLVSFGLPVLHRWAANRSKRPSRSTHAP